MKQTAEERQRYAFRRIPEGQLVLTPHTKGFFKRSVEPGDNLVFMGKAQITESQNSVKLVKQLAIEVRADAPRDRQIEAERWLVRALYQHGGPMLTYESDQCRGALYLNSEADGAFGWLALQFEQPRLDLEEQGQLVVSTPLYAAAPTAPRSP